MVFPTKYGLIVLRTQNGLDNSKTNHFAAFKGKCLQFVFVFVFHSENEKLVVVKGCSPQPPLLRE